MATATLHPVQQPTKPAARFAWCVLGFFLLVVLWGAVVRATGSGGGCGNSWPLCNGYVNPLHHPRLATIIEFAHRQSTTVATLLMLTLSIWTFRVTPRGDRARRAAIWTLLLLITEALLGAALVLRHWVEKNDSTGRIIAQAVHFSNTLLLMGALTLTAWFLHTHPADTRQSGRTSKRVALTAIATTLLVGATGSLAALADTLFPSPTLATALAQDFQAHAPVLVRMRWLHPAAALLGLVCVLWMVRQSVRISGPWQTLPRTVVTLLAVQFVLGTADVLLLAPVWMQVLHLLGADLYWVALVALAASTLWPATNSSGAASNRA